MRRSRKLRHLRFERELMVSLNLGLTSTFSLMVAKTGHSSQNLRGWGFVFSPCRGLGRSIKTGISLRIQAIDWKGNYFPHPTTFINLAGGSRNFTKGCSSLLWAGRALCAFRREAPAFLSSDVASGQGEQPPDLSLTVFNTPTPLDPALLPHLSLL